MVADNFHIPESDRPKFIIIDEVQDISPAMFKGLQTIIRSDGYWTVFGDISQNIFGERISWSSLGLENIRKQYRMHRNYRNSQQIGRLAKNMLSTTLFSKDKTTFINPSLSAFTGPLPIRFYLNPKKPNQLLNHLRNYIRQGTTAIIVMDPRKLKEVKEILKENNIKIGNGERNSVFVDIIHRIKGLEFDSVIIWGIDDKLPDDFSNLAPDSPLATRAREIYVATTRARQNLILTYTHNPLNFLITDATLAKEE